MRNFEPGDTLYIFGSVEARIPPGPCAACCTSSEAPPRDEGLIPYSIRMIKEKRKSTSRSP